MKLHVATNNEHKVRELESLFPDASIITPREAGVDFAYEETEETFLGNSMGKARALFARLNAPVLADDSGLSVDALNGAPGVRSARYGSPEGGEIRLSDTDRYRLLLNAMKGMPDRRCRFVCAMCLVLSVDRFMVVQETCEGLLLETPRGNGGFGYDPVFLIPELGLSMAELTMEQKNAFSHRGRAAARMRAVLRSLSV